MVSPASGWASSSSRPAAHDFVILEKDADLGGTWRDNTYPGCDVRRALATCTRSRSRQNPDWTRMFSPQHGDLGLPARTASTSTAWPRTSATARRSPGVVRRATSGTWRRRGQRRGQTLHARALVAGVGALHMPKHPGPPRTRDVRGHDVPLRPVAPRPRPDRAQGRRRRHRRERDPVRARRSRPRSTHLTLFQRTRGVGDPEARPARSSGEASAFYARHPARRSERSAPRSTGLLELRGTGFALTPKAMTFIEKQARTHLDAPGRRPRAARQARHPTTRSAASGSCCPTTTTRR